MAVANPWSNAGITMGGNTSLNFGTNYSVDPDLTAKNEYDRQLRGKGLADAQIAIQPATEANAFKQQRFNAIFPWLTGQMGNLQSNMARPGGQSGMSPEITVGGVLNPQQIQQQVNAARSGNDQSAATQMQGQTATTAGQGFGANSPLLAALHGQTMASNLATNTGNERDIRLQAATGNAQNLLATQGARETQFANRQREDIQRRTPIWGAYGSLLGALSGLV